MILKGFKRPQIVEITDDEDVAQYLTNANEIELSTNLLCADNEKDASKNRMALRHELVHALDNHKGKLNSLFRVFMSEVRAYYYMVPRKNRGWLFTVLVLPFLPLAGVASTVSYMRKK